MGTTYVLVVPDTGVLQATLAQGEDVLLYTISDIYENMGRLASSVLQHTSSAGVTHDLLEQAVGA